MPPPLLELQVTYWRIILLLLLDITVTWTYYYASTIWFYRILILLKATFSGSFLKPRLYWIQLLLYCWAVKSAPLLCHHSWRGCCSFRI
jgi:hypothetical protein